MNIEIKREPNWSHEWESVLVSLEFGFPLDVPKQDRLDNLMTAIGCVGLYGAFGGRILSVTLLETTEQRMIWSFDMSGMNNEQFETAFAFMIRCLTDFSSWEARIHRVALLGMAEEV